MVDAQGTIVCGHTRYRAALKLGLQKVPVHVARDLTPEKIRAYRIADNKLAELATWDMSLLSVGTWGDEDLGVDLSLLGFSEEDLSKVFEDVKQGQTDPDNVPAPMDEAFAVKSEVYQSRRRTG